ncbi:hypothetical protein SESBI_47022 [Sesbania bispinosa]|nr:hypothetical protein SESBI_47022 [Sesbania bispinosa]
MDNLDGGPIINLEGDNDMSYNVGYDGSGIRESIDIDDQNDPLVMEVEGTLWVLPGLC